MEIKHFRLVKTIVEEGSIANSSEKLCLTQSALSHQLKELEKQLGFKVFHRTRNKWTLTEEGAELHKLGNTILKDIDTSFKNIQQIQVDMLNLIEDPNVNHVREMASHFNAKLDEGNDASTISMDNQKAKGFISSYRIFEGFSVWVYNITFFSDFKIDLDQSEDSPYYFCYNVEGHFLHRFGKQEEFTKILKNQNMIVKGSNDSNVEIVFPANIELKIAVIIVDLKLLGTQEMRNAKRIHSKVGKLFDHLPGHEHFRHLGEIDVETEKYASIVCQNDRVDLIGWLNTEGAVLNMLASQIKSLSNEVIENQLILNKSELSQLTSLGTFVFDNLESSFTIAELSKHFGMSPKKLQKGIKYLYGDSVGQYISSLRMGHAKHLLTTTELNVSEVCLKVGISSRSYFSKVFKSRYGVLPSHYLN